MWQLKREISRECNDIIRSAKGSQISEKYWSEVGKGKRADVYLQVRKRSGHIFFEWNKCLWLSIFFYCPFDFLLRLFNNKKIILTKVTMTVLLVMTNNSVLMQHNIRLVQLPFYNITPNISVCNNYISPYFFATCIQYNFANRVNLSSACVQI